MVVEAAIPKLGTLIAAAAIDSINPCAIGVLILLISVMISRKTRGNMLLFGFAYVGAVFLTYLVAGLGLMTFISMIPLAIAQYISLIVAVAIAFAALVEIKDFYWYGRGFSLAIPPDMAKRIHKYVENLTLPGVIFLGAFVAAVELPCTGAPYLAIILLLSYNFDFYAFLLLVLYNIIFVAPLVAILLLVHFGMK